MGYDWTVHYQALAANHGEAGVVRSEHEDVEVEVPDLIWSEQEAQLEQGEQGARTAQADKVVIRVSRLTHCARGYTIERTATGETWTVTKAIKVRNAVWECDVERVQVEEATHGRYRPMV